MNAMTEFMSRETIKEKIDEISEKFFDFQLVDMDVHKSVEDDMHKLIAALSDEVAKHGRLEDNYPMVAAYLMDTILAQLIVVKLQNKFIENCKRDKDDDTDE